ncbi:family 13 glycoside hydrolase [Yasminevirus sp. GU-2018]|uniref:Family 13 glycoside hydrolase n=1 Tax=Yasminevirus sp. GU-2018 TaxID=2420051 RepID=A0A5K0U9U8_9VIRU|nr:family 13 glycoside hydrolase [Yasminevirus sp. GU-2018]
MSDDLQEHSEPDSVQPQNHDSNDTKCKVRCKIEHRLLEINDSSLLAPDVKEKLIARSKAIESFKRGFLQHYNVNSLTELTDQYLSKVQRVVEGKIQFSEWFGQGSENYIKKVSLVGDFNGWDPTSNVFTREGDDFYCVTLESDSAGRTALMEGDKFAINLELHTGENIRRISATAKSIEVFDQTDPGNPETTFQLYYDDSLPKPEYITPKITGVLKIYELHVGMMKEGCCVSSYEDVAKMIPHIKRTGYTAVELMGVVEHTCYESFGYLSTNYFAPSSRFGSPADFKEMVSAFHDAGILVLLDIVHTHSADDVYPGLKDHAGTGSDIYFEKDRKTRWGSLYFDYKNYEVLRFLLANLRWWLTEYQIDGFRFDAVNEVIYKNSMIENFNEYFEQDVFEAIAYFTMANELVHSQPNKITIAEDYFGMPFLCEVVENGGIGFDYRQQTGVAETFQRQFESHNTEITKLWSRCDVADENDVRDSLNDATNKMIANININQLINQLKNRRIEERTIMYTESHDQQIVGHRTFLQNLMGPFVYDNMSIKSSVDPSLNIKRLSQEAIFNYAVNTVNYLILIRLIAFLFQRGGIMTFAGNEFMHPDWLELPSRQNGHNSEHTGRRWSLLLEDVETGDINTDLLYKYAYLFEKAFMQSIDSIFDQQNSEENLNKTVNEAVSIYNHDSGLLEIKVGNYYVLINFSTNNIYHHPTHVVGTTKELNIRTVLDTYVCTGQNVELQDAVLRENETVLINNRLFVKGLKSLTGVVIKLEGNYIICSIDKCSANKVLTDNVDSKQKETVSDEVKEPKEIEEDVSTTSVITDSEDRIIRNSDMIMYYTYDHYKEEEFMYLVTSIMSIVREIKNVAIIVWTTTYKDVSTLLRKYYLDNVVFVKRYVSSMYGHKTCEIVSPNQKYFNSVGHARIYITPYLQKRYGLPVVYLDNDTGLLQGRGKAFRDLVMRTDRVLGFRMEKWTTLYNLYDEMGGFEVRRWMPKDPDFYTPYKIELTNKTAPINNGILVFGRGEYSLRFSEFSIKVYEDLTEKHPYKFNDMTAFTLVWYAMKGGCLVYNEFFRDTWDWYEYNGEIIYDEPSYTFYHYYLEKYHDSKPIIAMCRNAIDRFRGGGLNSRNDLRLVNNVVDDIF